LNTMKTIMRLHKNTASRLLDWRHKIF